MNRHPIALFSVLAAGILLLLGWHYYRRESAEQMARTSVAKIRTKRSTPRSQPNESDSSLQALAPLSPAQAREVADFLRHHGHKSFSALTTINHSDYDPEFARRFNDITTAARKEPRYEAQYQRAVETISALGPPETGFSIDLVRFDCPLGVRMIESIFSGDTQRWMHWLNDAADQVIIERAFNPNSDSTPDGLRIDTDQRQAATTTGGSTNHD